MDDAGNFYIVYATAKDVRYAFKKDLEDVTEPWKVCIVGDVPDLPGLEVYGVSAVAGGEGRLAVAWFAKESIAGPWQVRMRIIENAHHPGGVTPTAHPSSSRGALVDDDVADAVALNFIAFRDFLSIDKFPDGHVIIAYNCYHTNPANSPCGTPVVQPDGTTLSAHPRVAEQTGGIGLN